MILIFSGIDHRLVPELKIMTVNVPENVTGHWSQQNCAANQNGRFCVAVLSYYVYVYGKVYCHLFRSGSDLISQSNNQTLLSDICP